MGFTYHYNPGEFTFLQAKDECADLGKGWTLPVPQSVEVNTYLKNIIDSSVWLGISDDKEENVWLNMYTGTNGH